MQHKIIMAFCSSTLLEPLIYLVVKLNSFINGQYFNIIFIFVCLLNHGYLSVLADCITCNKDFDELKPDSSCVFTC